MGFYDQAKGPIYDIDNVYTLYQAQGIIGCGLAFVLLGFVGKLTDKISIKYMLPIGLFMRAVVFFLVYNMSDPTIWYFYIIVPLLHVSYYGVVII